MQKRQITFQWCTKFNFLGKTKECMQLHSREPFIMENFTFISFTLVENMLANS
jgi:hypothetical protein